MAVLVFVCLCVCVALFRVLWVRRKKDHPSQLRFLGFFKVRCRGTVSTHPLAIQTNRENRNVNTITVSSVDQRKEMAEASTFTENVMQQPLRGS